MITSTLLDACGKSFLEATASFNPLKWGAALLHYLLHASAACVSSQSAVHEAFRLFAERAYNERYVAVGRYVIMPDHVHLFIRGDEEFMLGRWVAALKQALAKSAGRAKSTGRIWLEGFFDHVLRNDESYAQKWEYVRQNPVRAGLVTSAEDWEYQGEIVIIDRV